LNISLKHSPDSSYNPFMINQSELLDHFDHNRELILHLTQVLEDTYPDNMQKLEQGIEEKSFEEIELQAHSLKGMISNFFADDLKNIAFEMEKKGRDKDDSQLDDLFHQLQKQLPQLVENLKIIGNKNE
tara:strand:+ start:8632 stop:9018 length:387 start_codon:yes stop_codon:yes gene_type:complete